VRVRSSDELPLPEHLLQGGVSLSSGPNEARDGDSAGLADVDSSIFVELNGEGGTSAMESWMEEWSLEVMMRSV
jgi:hypothetical protein